MIEMLGIIRQGFIVLDLGSGCGLTANTFAKFWCWVEGYEPNKRAIVIAKKYAQKLGVSEYIDYT